MAENIRSTKHQLPGNYTTEDSDGEKLKYSIDLLFDAGDQMWRDSLTARFPSHAGESALALIGADRGIIRGRSETKEHYAQRLIAWRYPRGHRVRGNAFAALEQISEYFGGGVDVLTVDANGTYHEREPNGNETYSFGSTWEWDDLPASPHWGRFWVIIIQPDLFEEQPDLDDPDLWGGSLGNPAYTLGQLGVVHDDVLALRKLFRGARAWRPAGTRPEWIIVSMNGAAPSPDGFWGTWSTNVGGTQSPTRSDAFRYWSISPEHNNTYAGDPTNFCDDTYMPDGSVYAGDPTSFPASTTLPDGSVYAGNPANSPVSARLVDDGSIP